MGNYQYTTGPRMGEPKSPTIGIRAYGFKWCLIFAQKWKLSKSFFDHTTM
jgi:hypothetical protein